MAQIFLALLLIGVAVVALKVAIALLLLAGLIFRTRETIGLIVVMAAFGLLRTHPVVACIAVGLFLIIALVKKSKEKTGVELLQPPPD